MSPGELTFTAVDGLAFAATRGRLVGNRSTPPALARELGPLIEFHQLSEAGLLPKPEEASWLALDGVSLFYAALMTGRQRWVCPASRSAGFFRTGGVDAEDETPWIEFGLATQRAAASAGFMPATARQFVGALGELVSNIYEHYVRQRRRWSPSRRDQVSLSSSSAIAASAFCRASEAARSTRN